MRTIKFFVICTLLALYACGSSSDSSSSSSDSSGSTSDTTAPTISSVTTYNGSATDATLSTTAGDRVSGASNSAFFTITFSEAMGTTTVTATNITLSCNSASVTVGTPATSDNITWTIPVSSDLTGYVSCTLTLGTGLKDSAGNALASAATYAFNTQCSTDDSFTVDTLGFSGANDAGNNCWNYTVTGAGTPSATAFTVDTTNALVTFSANSNMAQGNYHFIYKTFSASSFEALLEIAGAPPTGAGCYLYAVNSSDQSQIATVKAQGLNCLFNIISSETNTSCSQNGSISPQNPLYFQLTWDGANASAKYGFGSSSSLSALTAPANTAVSLGSSYRVGVACEGTGNSSFVQTLGSFTIDATAAGPGTQY